MDGRLALYSAAVFVGVAIAGAVALELGTGDSGGASTDATTITSQAQIPLDRGATAPQPVSDAPATSGQALASEVVYEDVPVYTDDDHDDDQHEHDRHHDDDDDDHEEDDD